MEVGARRVAGELAEIVDEMGLIVVTAIEGDFREGSQPHVPCLGRRLEPQHPGKPFGRKSCEIVKVSL